MHEVEFLKNTKLNQVYAKGVGKFSNQVNFKVSPY